MWYQLQIEHCEHDEVEQLSEVLEEMGALSVTFTDKHDDPILEPEPGTTPLWPEVVINALFNEQQEAQVAQQMLLARNKQLSFSIQEIAQQDWQRVCMDDFKPLQFGEKFWICPSWLEPPEPEAANLILDPGLAFGTGTHPTTALCLTWLAETELQNKTVIDYGCGSGILGLAVLKLGARSVEAVDIDKQALQATQTNALNNAISMQQLTIGLPEILQDKVDLIIANILLAPLLDLQHKFRELLKDQGTLVVSGVLDRQASSLIEAYQPDFIHQSSAHQEGWSLLIFRRR